MHPRSRRRLAFPVLGILIAFATAWLIVQVTPVRSIVSSVLSGSFSSELDEPAAQLPGALPTRELGADGPRPRSANSPDRYPVSVSMDGRFLVDSMGDPWFGRGDTAWSLFVELTLDEAEAYLNDRASKGFNLILVNVLEHKFARNAPANVAGDLPFVADPFRSEPNEAYWEHVDRVVDLAAEDGIVLLLCPAYMGNPGTEEGWDTELAKASPSDLAAYGDFLARRYSDERNIMWLLGHDQIPDEVQKRNQEALADQLPEQHLMGLGATQGELASRSWGETSISPDFETVYTYSDDPDDTVDAWLASDSLPVFFLEGKYEQEGVRIGDVQLRRQMYGPFMSGASVVIFGNNPIWNFEANPLYPHVGSWEENLDSLGSLDASTFGDFVDRHDWPQSEPDIQRRLMVTGEGDGPDRATARISDDLALVYVPSSRTLVLDLSVLAQPASEVAVTWFDPTSGIPGKTRRYASKGTVELVTPGPNAGGDEDWVLLITRSP